ncbi:MAG: LytTR family DNA-binding domain-containing protein [Bacillota bacterium]|nr:LytTR family DNA-binding domain-containing protein [Bacillota bacterium]
MLNIAVCDDDPIQSRAIMEMVNKAFPQKLQPNIVDFNKVEDFLVSLETVDYDIALLDVDLGVMDWDGVDVAKAVNEKKTGCQIIFVTNYLEFASKAYEAEHTYFVFKGEIQRYLPQALKKARENIEKEKYTTLSFQVSTHYVVLKQKDILYMETTKRKTNIITVDAVYSTYETLDELTAKVSEPPFARCHKSYTVNMKHMTKFSKTQFHCETGKIIAISRPYYEHVKALFTAYLGEEL